MLFGCLSKMNYSKPTEFIEVVFGTSLDPTIAGPNPAPGCDTCPKVATQIVNLDGAAKELPSPRCDDCVIKVKILSILKEKPKSLLDLVAALNEPLTANVISSLEVTGHVWQCYLPKEKEVRWFFKKELCDPDPFQILASMSYTMPIYRILAETKGQSLTMQSIQLRNKILAALTIKPLTLHELAADLRLDHDPVQVALDLLQASGHVGTSCHCQPFMYRLMTQNDRILSATQGMILDALSAKPATAADLAQDLDTAQDQILDGLSDLIQTGRVRCEGAGQDQIWNRIPVGEWK